VYDAFGNQLFQSNPMESRGIYRDGNEMSGTPFLRKSDGTFDGGINYRAATKRANPPDAAINTALMKYHASLYNVATPEMSALSGLEWPFRPVKDVFKESIQNGGGEKLRGIDSNYIYPPHVLSDIEDVNKLIAGDVWPDVSSNTGKVITVVSASLVHLTSYTKSTLKRATLKNISSSKGLWTVGGEFDDSVFLKVVEDAVGGSDEDKNLLLNLLKYVVVKRHAHGGGENDVGGGENDVENDTCSNNDEGEDDDNSSDSDNSDNSNNEDSEDDRSGSEDE
jgi:hypothetical protein